MRVTGKFGSGTHAAVEAFQSETDLHVDGTVGEDTWKVLETFTATKNPPPIVVDDDSDGAEAAGKLLERRGNAANL